VAVSKQEIVAVARRILAKEIDPLVGCRSIVRHQDALSDEERRDQDLLTLVGIESETDHFPLGDVRLRWDPEALAHQDRQRAEYLQTVEGTLYDACSSIIEKFS
jgi:tRNA G37 N-methylase Trm5